MRLLSINPLIEEVLALCSNELSEQRIEVAKNTSDSEELCFQGDAVQIQQVLMNLIRNSIQAMSGVSDLPRRLTITSFQEDKKLVLVVEDTGPVSRTIGSRLTLSFSHTNRWPRHGVVDQSNSHSFTFR